MRNVAAQATVRLTAKGDCLQMDKEALAQVKTLCFLKTMFSSVRELRSKGADVQVCRSITGKTWLISATYASKHTRMQSA